VGALDVGDELFDAEGRVCHVAGVGRLRKARACFRITFDDGTLVVADRDHAWMVEERGKRMDPTWQWTMKAVTTAELIPKKHYIWRARPLELPDIDLPIHPYVLGVWLGDGTSESSAVTQGIVDAEELRAQLTSVGCELKPNQNSSRADIATFSVRWLLPKLRSLGVLSNKHIPTRYLRSSLGQRLMLLQGLMDTDGSISEKLRVCEFTTILPSLRDGFAGLLPTLGIRAKCVVRPARYRQFPNGNRYLVAEAFQFGFTCPEGLQVFRLPRKRALAEREWRRHARRTARHGIALVKPVSSPHVRHVVTSSQSHLCLVGAAMVPTHDSSRPDVGSAKRR
jgi:hypothetical protein